MTEPVKNLAQTLATINADLNALGWDKPAQFYQLIQDSDDPIAQLIGVLPTYPPTDLQAGYDAGSRCPEHVLGLVLSHEAWRHLTMDELLERAPDMIEKIKEAARRDNYQDVVNMADEQMRRVMADYYMEKLVHTLPAPSQMPPNMRMEIRITTAVLRDGTVQKLIQTRDGDVKMQIDRIDGTERIPDVLYMFLHGVRPDPECEDPIRVVEDFKTLEALAALPVTEER